MKFYTKEISDSRFEQQGLRHITVKSDHLNGRGDITVFVPQGFEFYKGMPMVTLLHGVYGSHWAWAYKAGVHLTAQRLIDEGTIGPMLLVMPSDGLIGDGSGYLRQHPSDYEAWIVSDVPAVVQELIPQADATSPQFIAGLSMGGYGALRIGAKYSDQYVAFSGLSSITRFEEIEPFYQQGKFGLLEQAVWERESVLEVLLKHKAHLSPFRFDCGEIDPLIVANRQLHQALLTHQIDHHFEENSGGHDWAYWEKNIVNTLHFFNCRLKTI
ncbi:alpha/beta hydrolase [Dyadobacter tibetensis]|uniref:alpha/beta hydrolase n=1 Tax=Dyadobacter tibetensis TaxID=1211851 RepID=UPI00046F97BC|nr:alpha/beta hydrolase-fold protein [Dyadobacter tibetensis]